jgi:SpoVK/Ycf46/Vps4 family AAA+-type ATPase
MLARELWTEKSVSVKGVFSDYDVSTNDIIYELNQIKTGKSVLIQKEYFELDKTDIADNIEVIWGPRVLEAFEGYEDLLLQESSGKELQKIEFKDIKSKNLYYNESNEKDIERLESIMREENYLELRKRLDEKGLPKGLTVLLYGAPGTGKTETVMQLARKTGRDVYHLNIEQIKSCWVGESEKNIKAIFKSYYASKAKIKPILLFNEADAIISKRTSVDGSNAAVTKMENAIQNLLLEELEKFDGIFIATTNRATDIDSAFDRRLLFKLKFENPNVPVKVKIWKDRLDWLDDNDANKLAERYDLSGGQIDNIYRKSEIDYLLYGKKPSVDELLDFCKKEKLGNEGSSKIGFCN